MLDSLAFHTFLLLTPNQGLVLPEMAMKDRMDDHGDNTCSGKVQMSNEDSEAPREAEPSLEYDRMHCSRKRDSKVSSRHFGVEDFCRAG